ncbi:uncharacterized protein UDID_05498 [Ustilago sp. UG-2017a]|nr:uncharacterized protein UDID_05498 [Ustilago sp. UG-2017a]
MAGQAESSKFSVNGRLARAREQDLRRARNLQAKLVRAQDGAQSQPKALSHAFAPQPQEYESPSSRAGLMFMSSIEQARREREQRTGERHLKRQVAGPMPPESWRDDFDRLSIRRGNASHLNRQRLQALMSSTTAPLGDQDWRERTDSQFADAAHTMTPTAAVRAKQRAKQRATCAGLRRFYDSSDPFHESRPLLSLCDMALCVIADSLNRPPSTGDKGTRGKARDETSEIDHLQKAEVLEYLPAHMRQRMMALCGRLAFTKQPLCDSVAQALTHADITEALEIDQSGLKDLDGAEDDWEASAISYEDLGSTLSAKRGDAFFSLDLSFSSIAKHTMHRMFFTMHGGQMFVSLRMLSLAGWNNSFSNPEDQPNTIDTSLESIMSTLARLPNLETLSLAGSRISGTNVSRNAFSTESETAASILRKLSRSLPKLRTLDLSCCDWVSADAILGVQWATCLSVAWPHLENLVLVGCKAFADPEQLRGATAEGLISKEARWRDVFSAEAAGSYVAPWHAKHSQRATQGGRVINGEGPTVHQYHMYVDNDLRHLPYMFSNLEPSQTLQRGYRRATFLEFVNNTAQPRIGYATTGSRRNLDSLTERVHCPRTTHTVSMWQWQRARVLEAVRGRLQSGARHRKWVEVWF